MRLSGFSEKKKRLLGMVAMLFVAVFWAVVEALGGLLPNEYSPVQTVWSRYLVHIVFMLVAFGPFQRSALVRTGCLGMQVSRAFLMIGMPFFFIAGVRLLPLNYLWPIFWCTSIMILFMAWIILKESISIGLWILNCIGFIGTLLVLDGGMPTISWRLLMPVGMGFCYALYVILTRIMRMESAYTNLFHTALWVVLPLSLIMPLKWKMPSIYVAGIYISIGLSGYWLLFFLDKSLELAPAALTAPLIYTVPIWSLAIHSFAYKEVPVSIKLIGAIIIIAATGCLITFELISKYCLVESEKT